MAAEIIAPFEKYTDMDGNPLENGQIFVGVGGVEPQSNPIQVYWDPALTIPAAQPIRTINGYTVRFGTPSEIYLADDSAPYSIKVLDNQSLLVYSSLNEFGSVYDITTYINGLVARETLDETAGPSTTDDGTSNVNIIVSDSASSNSVTLPAAIAGASIRLWKTGSGTIIAVPKSGESIKRHDTGVAATTDARLVETDEFGFMELNCIIAGSWWASSVLTISYT